MNVNLGIWGKLNRVVVFLLVLATVLGTTLWIARWYWPLIKHNEQMRKKILELDTKIQKEEEIAKQQKTSIDAMRTDPKTVERLARETLSYAKPGEIVIRFEPPPTNNPVKR